MKTLLRWAAALAACAPFAAAAQGTLTYDGTLTDDRGAAVNASHDMTFRLYPAAEGADPLWEEAETAVPVVGGRFSAVLGDDAPLPPIDADAPLFLAVQVDGHDEFSPRMRVGTALRARFAAQAGDVAGRDIHPASVSIGDRLIIDGDGQWVGPPLPEGPRGEPGPEGPQGEIGPAGPQGEIGPAGPIGLKGDEGSAGPAGPVGPQGEVGPMGPAGPRGEQGPAGPRGEQGPAGPRGEQGLAGPQGEIGPAGPRGEQGPAGPLGEQGPAGPAGPQGEQGERGPRGLPGARGPRGNDGPAGPQGEQGPAGDDAFQVSWDRAYSYNCMGRDCAADEQVVMRPTNTHICFLTIANNDNSAGDYCAVLRSGGNWVMRASSAFCRADCMRIRP